MFLRYLYVDPYIMCEQFINFDINRFWPAFAIKQWLYAVNDDKVEHALFTTLVQ